MLCLAALISSLAVAGAAAEPMPAALRPSHILGAAVNVADLDAERDWYVAKLGMQVVGQYPAKGTPFEWFLAFDKTEGHATVTLTKKARPPGANPYGRTIIQAPDAKGLAAWLKTQGVAVREAVPGMAYFVEDPEQNQIELYTPPK